VREQWNFCLVPTRENRRSPLLLEIAPCSYSTAMWGDNTCPILLSDLYTKDVLLVDIGLDFKVKVRILGIELPFSVICLQN